MSSMLTRSHSLPSRSKAPSGAAPKPAKSKTAVKSKDKRRWWALLKDAWGVCLFMVHATYGEIRPVCQGFDVSLFSGVEGLGMHNFKGFGTPAAALAYLAEGARLLWGVPEAVVRQALARNSGSVSTLFVGFVEYLGLRDGLSNPGFNYVQGILRQNAVQVLAPAPVAPSAAPAPSPAGSSAVSSTSGTGSTIDMTGEEDSVESQVLASSPASTSVGGTAASAAASSVQVPAQAGVSGPSAALSEAASRMLADFLAAAQAGATPPAAAADGRRVHCSQQCVGLRHNHPKVLLVH